MHERAKGKIIIITGPSGAGKNTLASHAMEVRDDLMFAVSATSRAMRPGEKEGVNYYYLTEEAFQERIDNGEFVEWEQIYEHQKSGVLWSELERIWGLDKTVISDTEVKGAKNLKEMFGDNALTIFLDPGSLEILEQRLRNRKTESEEAIKERMTRAQEEMEYKKYFDAVILNDNLDDTKQAVEQAIANFLDS